MYEKFTALQLLFHKSTPRDIGMMMVTFAIFGSDCVPDDEVTDGRGG